MKTTILFAAVCLLSISSVKGQNVNIPDANFKAYLVGNSSINTNADSEIQVTEAQSFNGAIACYNMSINSLVGIEAFTSLTQLNCFMNNLTVLDLSNNTSLFMLNCKNNQLSSLDLSANTQLFEVNCANNSLTSLDLSIHTGLERLDCSWNLLNSLNVANGNNTNMYNLYFSTINNPPLTCIEVDDAAWSTANWVNIDAQTDFSEDCGNCVVTIPDANFKAYLVGNSSINTNADAEIQCSEATAFTGQINCSSMTISNLTGIEAFTNLTQLMCYDNQLTNLDLSSNTALERLYCEQNQLTALDLSNNTALIYLYCSGNQLASLDISANVALINLECDNNQLTSLNVSSNPDLTRLNCNFNQLTSMNFSSNPVLTFVWCGQNQLSNLDFSANQNLGTLYCFNNQLTSLNVKNTNNVNFDVLDATGNPNLTCIEVDNAAFCSANWTGGSFQFDAQNEFSEDCGLGINENQLVLNLYPNPVNNTLTIESKQSSWASINNSTGQNIAKVHINNGINQLPVQHLAPGLYFVVDENGNQLKFIKE